MFFVVNIETDTVYAKSESLKTAMVLTEQRNVKNKIYKIFDTVKQTFLSDNLTK